MWGNLVTTNISSNYTQGDHLPGKPGIVREFKNGQGKVRENEKSQGKVRNGQGIEKLCKKVREKKFP